MCNYLDNPDKGSSQVTKKLSLSQVESPPMLGSEKLKNVTYPMHGKKSCLLSWKMCPARLKLCFFCTCVRLVGILQKISNVVVCLWVALATTVSRSRERLEKLPWVPPETHFTPGLP